MEDTYGFSWRFCWTPRNASGCMATFEGVVRNHLARLSQQQERDFYNRQRIEQSALFRLQSQHIHLKEAEQKACVSFCAHNIFVMLHPPLYKVRLCQRVCLCRKQKFWEGYKLYLYCEIYFVSCEIELLCMTALKAWSMLFLWKTA